jgi:hypothetical protein
VLSDRDLSFGESLFHRYGPLVEKLRSPYLDLVLLTCSALNVVDLVRPRVSCSMSARYFGKLPSYTKTYHSLLANPSKCMRLFPNHPLLANPSKCMTMRSCFRIHEASFPRYAILNYSSRPLSILISALRWPWIAPRPISIILR